jgi:chromosome segregation ATPase
MLTRVVVNHFKNFKEETIILADPTNDHYFFDVVVGRNGSGKSCLLEAIEFCLCNKSARDLRAASMKDLVNVDSTDGKMKVSVELISTSQTDETRSVNKRCHYNNVVVLYYLWCNKMLICQPIYPRSDTLKITRSFNGKVSKTECIRCKGRHITNIISADIPEVLTHFGLSPERMNGIRIKQNQSTVACLSPLALLEFIETMCGSIEQKKIIDSNNAKTQEMLMQVTNLDSDITNLKSDLLVVTPILEDVKNYFMDVLMIRHAQIAAAAQSFMLINESSNELDISSETKSKTLKDIHHQIKKLKSEKANNETLRDDINAQYGKKKKAIGLAQRALQKYNRQLNASQQDIVDKEASCTEKARDVQKLEKKVSSTEYNATHLKLKYFVK